MSIENFLKSTLENIKAEHNRILNTPRCRASRELKGEIMEFKDYCGWLMRGGDRRSNM